MPVCARAFPGSIRKPSPPAVDPCGENGEFHTFAYAGPMLRAPIPIERGEARDIGGFVYADLLPCGESSR